MINWISNWLQYFYDDVLRPLYQSYWPRVQPYWHLLKSAILHSTAAFIISSLCLYVSAFLFGALYYYSMPTTYQSYQLSFQYKRSCIQEHRNFIKNGQGSARQIYAEDCFPYAVVDFNDPPNKKIDPHQTYGVHLTLQLPESSSNLNVGMFMTTMKYGESVSSRPVSMKHYPSIIRTISTVMFWPFLLFDMMTSSQTIHVQLFERINFNFQSHEKCSVKAGLKHGSNLKAVKSVANHFLDGNLLDTCSNRMALLQIDYPDLEIDTATLHVTAVFSGLQYLLFQWPLFSFLLGTMIFFTPVMASFLVLIYIITKVKSAAPSQSRENVEPLEDNTENLDVTDSRITSEGQGEEEERLHLGSQDDDDLRVSSSGVTVIGSSAGDGKEELEDDS